MVILAHIFFGGRTHSQKQRCCSSSDSTQAHTVGFSHRDPFIHYLPYGVRNTLYSLSGHDPTTLNEIFRTMECHHVPLTLDFVVSGMVMVAEPIGLAR